MYAFKTERPDAARRYHNKFVTGTNYQEESKRRFALSEPTENILRTSILESGWLIKNITLRDVNAVSGNAVNIGASELHTGRVDGGGQQYRAQNDEDDENVLPHISGSSADR